VTLLTPIPMLIAAGLTVPVLLGLYFLRLRRRPVRISSVQFWASTTRDLQVNVPLRMISPSWLLFLHLLILAMFLTALGRPAINMTGAESGRVVILIDRSASMSATDTPAGRSRLELAKGEARRIVDDLARSSTGTMIVAFAASPEPLTPFTKSTRELRRAIDTITPTDQPGNLARALGVIDALAEGEGHDDESPSGASIEGVLISDGSFDSSESRTLRRGTLRYVRVGPDAARAADNLAVVALSAARDPEHPELIRVFARVQSNRAEPTRTSIRLNVDGVERIARAITLPPATPDAPGDAVQTFELRQIGPTRLTVSIDRQDDLLSDNGAGLVVGGARRPRIVFISPNDRQNVSIGAFVLAEVLEAVRPSRLLRLDAAGYADLAGTLEDEFDLFVFDRVRPEPWPRAATLAFGIDCEPAGVTYDGDPGRLGDIVSWDRGAAALTDVSLDDVVVGLAPRVQIRPTDRIRIEELARARDTGLIFRLRGAIDAVLVTFELDQSNWPLGVGFPIFVANVIESFNSAGRVGVSFRTDQIVELDAPLGAVVSVTDADGNRVADGTTRESRAAVGVIPRVGLYSVTGADHNSVAINLSDPHESMLKAEDAVRVAGRQIESSGSARARPREVWIWFVIAAGMLLLIEWVVFGVQSRV